MVIKDKLAISHTSQVVLLLCPWQNPISDNCSAFRNYPLLFSFTQVLCWFHWSPWVVLALYYLAQWNCFFFFGTTKIPLLVLNVTATSTPLSYTQPLKTSNDENHWKSSAVYKTKRCYVFWTLARLVYISILAQSDVGLLKAPFREDWTWLQV